jgi:cytochrome c
MLSLTMLCNPHRFIGRAPGDWIRIALALAVAALVNAAWGAGVSPEALLDKYRCTICHAEREAAAGPAWVDIATHYRQEPHADKLIADKIVVGVRGSGPWHMPPHPEVSKADAETMARYILTIKSEPH